MPARRSSDMADSEFRELHRKIINGRGPRPDIPLLVPLFFEVLLKPLTGGAAVLAGVMILPVESDTGLA